MALPRAVAECLPHNPRLDEEQAHRACVAEPVPQTLAAWDALASAIAFKNSLNVEELAERHGMVLLRPSVPGRCGCTEGSECTGGCGWSPLTLSNLQPYMADCSARVARQALCAGFFPFGSEYQLPGLTLSERSFLNFELAGEGAGRENGRIVLDLAGGGAVKGRKARKAFVDCVEPIADCTVEAWCGKALRSSATTPIDFTGPVRGVLTINRAFEAVYSGIVAAKGIDWMGFARVRRMVALLRDRTAGENLDGSAESQLLAGVRLISTELWDAGTGRLIGGTVGFAAGAAYSMLSLYDLAGDAMPQVGRALIQGTVLRLHQGGVQLFDAGTTAGYFENLYGFHRTTRSEFLRLWRKHRRENTNVGVQSAVWSRPCTSMHTLLSGVTKSSAQVRPAAARPKSHPAHNTRAVAKRSCAADATEQGGGKLPSAVVLTGQFEKSQQTEAAICSAMGSCGEVLRCIVKTGMAIIQFSTPAQAVAAAKLSGTLELNAQQAAGVVQICLHVPRKRAKAQKRLQQAMPE